MKKSRHFLAVLATVCLMFAGNAQAVLIVDTGAGSPTSLGFTVFADQWLAGQFTTTASYTLTSVEGWFGEDNEGTLTAAIYTDNGSGIPISELFATQFVLDAPIPNPDPTLRANAWDGAFGLSWTLAPGTYWLSFERRSGDTGKGYMPNSANGAPSPLADYAVWTTALGWNSAPSSLALGMRIDAIPVPPALWLFGSGLLGLIGIARRKKAA